MANMGNRAAADVRLTVQHLLDDAASDRIDPADLDRLSIVIQRAQAKQAQHTGIMPGQPTQLQPTGAGPIGGAAQIEDAETRGQTPVKRPVAVADTTERPVPAYRQSKAGA